MWDTTFSFYSGKYKMQGNIFGKNAHCYNVSKTIFVSHMHIHVSTCVYVQRTNYYTKIPSIPNGTFWIIRLGIKYGIPTLAELNGTTDSV